MRFVIIGAGRVGLRTGRVLREEGHEVTLIERDEAKIRRARNQEFPVVDGDGSRESVLEDAGVANADVLGALTADLNVNFTAYDRQTLRLSDGHAHRRGYREEIYRKYADEVDEVIYPERLGALARKRPARRDDSRGR